MNTVLKKNKRYIDITNYYLNNSTPNSHKVTEAKYFKGDNGNKYYVDGKNVVLDYSPKEKEVAVWLSKTFGGTIYMLPRVNKPDGIKTADYLWNNEKWDLKEIKGNSLRIFESIIKNCRTSLIILY